MKKRSLRLVSIFIAFCCLLLSFPALAVIAEETPTVILSSVSGYRGDELTVYVSISDNPGIAYLKLEMDFSPAISIVNTENSGNLSGTFTASESTSVKPYVLQWMGAEDSYNNGIIAAVTFKISDDAPYGEKQISVSVAESYNSSLEDVSFTVCSGTVTIFPTDIPNDVMNNNVGFSDNSYDFVKFGSDSKHTFNFSSPKGINNTKMIELDVFVDGEDIQNLGISIADGSNISRSYTFSGLTAGWNHLAVRIADLIQDAANGDFTDLSNITKCVLSGDSGAEVTVANMCAADYLEGDANRDGMFDLKDIVRAKKMASGITNEGNKLAVSGDDYEINATDITNLINSVIDSLFASDSGDSGNTGSNPHEMPKIKF